GTSMGLVASARDESVAFSDVLGQALATVPAVWALVAVAVATVGAVPRIRLLAWLAVVVTFGITLLGPTFKLSDAQLSASVFQHVPDVTGAADWTGLLVVSAGALVLVVVGLVGCRRRVVG